jgi:argininosuccinate lyase
MSSKRTAGRFPAPQYAENVLTHNFIDGQKYFFEHLMHIHYAHGLMLARQRILSRTEARVIFDGLDALDRARIKKARYDGSVEDLYFYVERELCKLIGEDEAGKLHIARSRNDIDVTLYRMKLREEVLGLTEDLSRLRRALVRLASENLETVMPAHTHTQPAQPTTLAHYLSAAIEFISRDIARLRAAYAGINLSPLGACAITTTGFPIDRAYTAVLLGFDEIAENSYGAIGAVDYLLGAITALATATLNLGKFTQDLLLWATQEFSFIRLGDAYVQTSSIMPQKRNPVALEHTRILLSKAFGQAQAVMTSVHNTPFGDINDVEDDLQPLVFAAFSEATRAIRLLAGAVEAIEVDPESLRKKAAGSFLTMTELADMLVRKEKLSFKLAHRLVALTVKQLSNATPSPEQIVAALKEVVETQLGRKLSSRDQQLVDALCPVNFVRVRRIPGGPAPETVADFLRRQNTMASEDQKWIRGQQKRLAAFPQKIARARKRFRR